MPWGEEEFDEDEAYWKEMDNRTIRAIEEERERKEQEEEMRRLNESIGRALSGLIRR